MAIRKQLIPLMIRERRICDLAISHLKQNSGIFEEKYKISSDDFYRLFNEGKTGDDEDMFEWKALIEGISEWEQTREHLNLFMSDSGLGKIND